MLSSDEIVYFMKETNELAKKALHKDELPIAALVVHDKKIISSSFAQEKAEKRRMVHADFLALEMADKIKPFPGKRSEMSLFVNLEPCLMCLGSALVFGIGAIYYSLESPIDGASTYASEYQNQLSNSLGYGNPIIQGDLLRDETLKIFEEYYKNAENSGYRTWVQSLLTSVNYFPK